MLLTTKSLVTLLLLCTFCTSAMAGDIKLYKSGTTLTLTQDLHCMNNATAMKLSTKLRLLPEKCNLKVAELEKLHAVELNGLELKLVAQKKEHLSVVAEKNKAIDKIQIASVDEVSKIQNSIWWKVTLGVVGGLVVGAGVAAIAITFSE